MENERSSTESSDSRSAPPNEIARIVTPCWTSLMARWRSPLPTRRGASAKRTCEAHNSGRELPQPNGASRSICCTVLTFRAASGASASIQSSPTRSALTSFPAARRQKSLRNRVSFPSSIFNPAAARCPP